MQTARVKSAGYHPTLDALIVALLGDYERRMRMRGSGSLSPRTAMEYRYIDYRIEEGAAEIVGEGLAGVYINEIGRRTGYAYSAVDVSEEAYKINKLEVKINIAKKLHLLD